MTAPVPLRKRAKLFPRPGGETDAIVQGDRFQAAAREATGAAAADAGDAFSMEVGQRLGGLAGIGALRSGGASAGVREAGKTFSTQVARASSANALQAAALGQQEAASQRGLGFSREELAARMADSAAGRGSNERIAGNELGFRREELGQRESQFTRDLGFRGSESALERGSREGMASAEIGSREKVASMDVQSREKLAALELEFRNRGLTSEEARAAARLEFDKENAAADLGFREKALGSEEQRFTDELGFRGREGEANRALERAAQKESQRQFNQQRADAEKAAQQKKKSGLFGFIGRAIGTAAGFIPGGGVIAKGVSTLFGGK